MPDSVINTARTDNQNNAFIDPSNFMQSGMASTTGSSGVNGMMSLAGTNLTELGQARGQLLSIKLDKA